MMAAQLTVEKAQILENDRAIMTDARSTELGPRLMTIPGFGPLLAARIGGAASAAFGAAEGEGRGGRLGQQDRADRDDRRALPRAAGRLSYA